MKNFWRGCMTLVVLLSTAGCSNFYRNVEAPYMRAGALDSPLTGYYDTYKVPLFEKYFLTHEWPVATSACQYGSLSALRGSKDAYLGDIFLARKIYEANGETRAEGVLDTGVSQNLDRFIRSQKRMIPISAKRDGVIYAGETVGYEEKEEGLRPVCFQYWAGTSHSLTMRLYKSSIEGRIAHYSKKQGTHSKEKIGDQTWWVWHYPFGKGTPNAYGGEAWVLPIGSTDYTLSLELGANEDSLQHPQAHAKMQAMFRRLLESVKIEPLTPAIEAEIAQLKAQAMEIQRQECLEMAKRTKPFKWCQKYLPQ